MNKTVSIPAALLEQVREIPGVDEMTDAQAVALCLEAGMEHARKEKALEALESLLDAQDADFSDMVLEYARALSGLNITGQGYLHSTAMSAAQLPQKHVRPVWVFVRKLAEKEVQA